jgi:hypothetical protein
MSQRNVKHFEEIIPRTMTSMVKVADPYSFSSSRVYLPLSERCVFAMVIDVMVLMISVLKRLASGSLPLL